MIAATATATAAVTRAAGDPFQLEQVRLAAPRGDEVIVRMVAAGVCHTDLSAAAGSIPFPLPGVLGHEGAGVVEQVGDRVTRARIGDPVLLTFTSCGRCAACRGGHPAYCADHLRLNLLGGRRADGSATLAARGQDIHGHFFGQSCFSTRALVDERSLLVLPTGITDSELAVLAPLGCGMQTGAGAVLNELRPHPGSTLAVTGAGAVGLAAAMAAAMTPAVRVIVVDRVASRLELAGELGALTVDTSRQDLPETLRELTDGRGVDFALETTGSTSVLEAMVGALAVRGQCAVVGAPPAGATASFDVNALLPGRTIRGVTLGDSEPETFLPLLIAAYRDGLFPLDRLQRTYPFEDINRAAADAMSGATVKPVLTFSSST